MICLYKRHNNKHNVSITQIGLNTLRQTGRQFAIDIVKCISLKEDVLTPSKISLEFIPKCPINIIPV